MKKGIQVQTVPKTKIEDLVGNAVHQGLVASIAAYEYADLEDVFKKAKEKGEDPFIVILDGVEDPHNLGSILRTADATGAHGIISKTPFRFTDGDRCQSLNGEPSNTCQLSA